MQRQKEAVESGDFRSYSPLFEDGVKKVLHERRLEKSGNPCEASVQSKSFLFVVRTEITVILSALNPFLLRLLTCKKAPRVRFELTRPLRVTSYPGETHSRLAPYR